MPDHVALTLPDTRADGAVRYVSLSPRLVTICRRYRGVAMRVSVPCAQYRGIGLLQIARGSELRHEITLLHRDADLNIPLASGSDTQAAAAQVHDWAAYFGLPELPGAPVAAGGARVTRLAALRRRSAVLVQRRRRHALRRMMGLKARGIKAAGM